MEAYPDVANNYVQIITQWPGRAAEEVEQQVTIPHRNRDERHPAPGAPAVHFAVRAFQPDADLRRRVRRTTGTGRRCWSGSPRSSLPNDLQPQIGTDYSPVGQIYWYTLKSTNPQYDLMELKSLEDWVLEKQFKSVPDVVDVVQLRRNHHGISGPI